MIRKQGFQAETEANIPLSATNQKLNIKNVNHLYELHTELQSISRKDRQEIFKKLAFEDLKKISIDLSSIGSMEMNYLEDRSLVRLFGKFHIKGQVLAVDIYLAGPDSKGASVVRYINLNSDQRTKIRDDFRFDPAKKMWMLDVIEEIECARASFSRSVKR